MAISSNASGLRPGVCTSTTRPTNPYTGQLIYETDTGYLRVWDGSAWDYLSQKQDTAEALPPETYMGLVKVIPTSATNGTVGATGTVTIGNAVSSVTVSGAFSSLYDNYRILVSGGTSSASNVFALTFGSQATAYYWSFLYSVWGGTTASADTGNNTTRFLYVGQTNTRGNYADISVVSPFLANDTYISASSPYGGGTYSGTVNGGLAVTTSFTSFTLTCNAGTVTGGTIRVYGYRN